MRTLGVAVGVVAAVAIVAGAVARAEDDADAKAEFDAAKAELDAIEKDVGSLAPNDPKAGNPLLKRAEKVGSGCMGSRWRAHAEWVPTLKRSIALEDRIVEIATGKKPTHEVDEKTTKANELLDAVAKEQETQPPGDAAATTRLLRDMNRARSMLVGSRGPTKKAALWIEAFHRAFVLEAKIRARGAEPGPAGEKPPAPATPAPATPAPEKPAPAPEPAASDLKLVKGERPPKTADRPTLDPSFFSKLDNAANRLAKATPEYFLDKKFDRPKEYMDLVTRLEGALHPYLKLEPRPQDVAWAVRWVAAYRARIEQIQEEARKLGAGLASESKLMDARLDELAAFFDPKTFKCHIDGPHTAERMRAWIADLKSWGSTGKKGLAELDELVKNHPTYAEDSRVIGLRRWFTKGLQERIGYGIDRTVRGYLPGGGSVGGSVSQLAAKANHLLEWKPFPEDKLSSDSWVTEALESIQSGILGCELLLIFAKEYEGKSDPEVEKRIPALRELQKKIEVGAVKAYESMRMPEAKSTSADLVTIAKKVLALPDTGATAYKRIVITKDKEHYVEHRKSTTDQGDRILIKTWTEEYDWFEVATAEKVEDSWRIVFYQLRKYTKALKGDSTYEWYCAVRNVWRRIPEANIDR